MSLPIVLMNPRGKRKNPKRVAAGKKAYKARMAKKASRSKKAKKTAKKRKPSKKARRSSGGSISIRAKGSVANLPKGTKVLFSKKPRVKRIKKRKLMKVAKVDKAHLRVGGSLKLKKGKLSIQGRSFMNPKRRKHGKKSHRRMHRKNPAFNLKKIAQFAGGAVAAVVVHKYGIAIVGNLLSKLPFVGQYAEKINTNKWANILSKGVVAGLVWKIGSKSRNEMVKNGSKAYAGAALALVAMQAIGVDSKLMLAQTGMGDLEGIEMNGIEMNGIEMNGIESLGEIEGYEMGEVHGDEDGLHGSEGVY